LTNLLIVLEEVTNYIDSGYPVDVIYLDFQKASDKVPNRKLIIKLEAHGTDRRYIETDWKLVIRQKAEWCLMGSFQMS